MRVLILGDANSIFIKSFIERVLLPGGAETALPVEGVLSAGYEEFYRRAGVALEPRPGGLLHRIPVVRSTAGALHWCGRLGRRYGRFDVVHVHGLNRFRGNMARFLRRDAGRVLLSVWGDEALRAGARSVRENRRFVALADGVTVSTEALGEAVRTLYGGACRCPVTLARFGNNIFDILDRLESGETREQSREKLGLSADGTRVVTVGHNARMVQRHRELLDVLARLPAEMRRRVTVVLPATYGDWDDAYRRELRERLHGLRCPVRVLTGYMDEDDVARLRRVTDVFLHAQQTDAFSAALQEHLYAGGTVLSGGWLSYPPLGGNGLVEYDDSGDLYGKLRALLSRPAAPPPGLAETRRRLRELSSWESQIPVWRGLYGLR